MWAAWISWRQTRKSFHASAWRIVQFSSGALHPLLSMPRMKLLLLHSWQDKFHLPEFHV
jgi:ABC-type uncharacterized transport system permease subunit